MMVPLSSDGSSAVHRERAERSRPWSPMANDDPAAADQEAAQPVEVVALGVFGNDALRGERQAEMDDVADQQQPGPGVDVDAELDAAHPARQQDLRQEDDRRAGDADDEGRAGHALRGSVLARQPRLQRAPAGRNAVRAGGQVFGVGQGHSVYMSHGECLRGSPWLE